MITVPTLRTLKRATFVVAAALLALAAALPASAQLLVNKSFSPANVAPAQTTTITIQVLNNTTTVATAVNVTDTFPTSPTGLRIGTAGLLSNTCGGTVTATAGGTQIRLTGGTVPAAVSGTAGSCTITVQAVSTPPISGSSTTYVNTIPTANVSSSIGGTSAPVSATLSVAPTLAITGTLAFTPAILKGDGSASRMRVTLNNPNTYAVTNTAFTDTFATTLTRAATPNIVTTCTSGTIGGTATTLTLAGATIAAGGSCYIEIDIVARTPAAVQNGSVTNSIATGGVTTDQKASNTTAISGAVTVQTGAAVTKVFSAATVSVGQNSTLTITVTNYRAVAIGPFALTDTLPGGLTIAGTASTTCNGGSVATTSGAVTLSGATLPAAPAAASGGTTCTVTVAVSATSNGSYVNTIPAGTIGGSSFSAASATLLVTAVRGTKAFSPTTAPRTGASVLTLKFYNRNTASPAAITAFTDDLTTMGADITIASAATTNTCGGTLTATAGSTTISLSGGQIPVAASSTSEGSCTITVTVQVSRTAAVSARTNTVPVGALQTSAGNSTVAFTAKLTVATALTVAHVFSPTSVVAGTTTKLTVTLTRAANAQFFTNLAVTDPLPSGFTIAASPAATTTCTGGTVTATPGVTSFSLAGGTTGTTLTAASSCIVSVNVLAPATTGSYTGTIPIGGATADTSQGAVANVTTATATATVISSVSLNTSFSPTTTTPGNTSRLSVFISSPASFGALSGMVLTDRLPTGLLVKSPANASFVAQSGTCTGTIDAVAGANIVRITGGTASAGALCELSFEVTTDSIGTLTNTLAPGALTSSQGYSNGNSASATLVSSGSAEVSITKTNNVSQITAGATTTYTLVVSNNSNALSVVGLPVTDVEQSGLNTESWTCTATSGSACEQAAGTDELNADVDLAPLGKATFTVVMTLAADFVGSQVVNTARINPAGAGISDSNSANDVASDTDTVARSADLAVTKTISNVSPRIGDTVTFVVTASNDGPSDAAEVVVTDALPSGYDVVSSTTEDGTWTAPTWTLSTLAAKDSTRLTVVATVRRNGDRTNSATIASTTADPVSTNNSVSVTPSIIDLGVTKTSTPVSDPFNGTVSPKAIPGATMEYRITITNETTGPIDADSIVITDVLPGQVAAYVRSPAIAMIDGSPASGLSFAAASDVNWSKQAGGGAPYDYVPVPDANGFDALVTGIRIKPRGQIAGGSPELPSSAIFTVRAKVK